MTIELRDDALVTVKAVIERIQQAIAAGEPIEFRSGEFLLICLLALKAIDSPEAEQHLKAVIALVNVGGVGPLEARRRLTDDVLDLAHHTAELARELAPAETQDATFYDAFRAILLGAIFGRSVH